MCCIPCLHLCTVPLIWYYRLKMTFIEEKQISSLYKTRMRVTVSVYEKKANHCLRTCTSCTLHSVLRACMTRKRAAYAYGTNLWIPATISWRLFAHFCTRKHAASMGLRHASMNVSAGLSDAYATSFFFLRLFLCSVGRQNVSSTSCHWALWAALQ